MAVARVTLLHGFLGSPADWADVLGHLAAEITCDCVALAELGCTSIDEASRQLATRLERSPCDLLVGYSLGGRIALDLAATRPALVPRLALFAAGMAIVGRKNCVPTVSSNLSTRGMRLRSSENFAHLLPLP